MYPQLNINLRKLKHNLSCLTTLCHSFGLSTAVVTKVFCADKRILEVINSSEADFIADSRIINLKRAEGSTKQRMLLRISSLSDVESVVMNADISLQSEMSTIHALGQATKQLSKNHKVVIMIDLGDLREGIFFENESGIFSAAQAVLDNKKLELYGIGTNLTCYGGILPDEHNLRVLADIANVLRERFSIELPFVSGGNSSTIEFLKSGSVPTGITNLRLGESFVLGKDTATCQVIDGMYSDAITLTAEIIEVQEKPSKPIGHAGKNAFGEEVTFDDLGQMRRGILAIGRQDTIENGLYCIDNNINVIGASSDHLLVDLTRSDVYNVGDTLQFTLDYGAVLHAFTSEYVSRKYIQ